MPRGSSQEPSAVLSSELVETPRTGDSNRDFSLEGLTQAPVLNHLGDESEITTGSLL